jgi:hypothetical protein
MWDFKLVTIEKTQAPEQHEGGNWYHYIIANKITRVSGRRRGSKAEVSKFVASCIQRLNTRHLSVPGKGSMSL